MASMCRSAVMAGARSLTARSSKTLLLKSCVTRTLQNRSNTRVGHPRVGQDCVSLNVRFNESDLYIHTRTRHPYPSPCNIAQIPIFPKIHTPISILFFLKTHPLLCFKGCFNAGKCGVNDATSQRHCFCSSQVQHCR